MSHDKISDAIDHIRAVAAERIDPIAEHLRITVGSQPECEALVAALRELLAPAQPSEPQQSTA